MVGTRKTPADSQQKTLPFSSRSTNSGTPIKRKATEIVDISDSEGIPPVANKTHLTLVGPKVMATSASKAAIKHTIKGAKKKKKKRTDREAESNESSKQSDQDSDSQSEAKLHPKKKAKTSSQVPKLKDDGKKTQSTENLTQTPGDVSDAHSEPDLSPQEKLSEFLIELSCRPPTPNIILCLDKAARKWLSPVYLCFELPMLRTDTVRDKIRTYQFFQCLKPQCTHGSKGGVRRYTNTKDSTSTKPLAQHIKACQPNLLNGIKNGTCEPPEHGSEHCKGDIIAMMKLKAGKKVYSSRPLTRAQIQ
jgi:hypothetical protein